MEKINKIILLGQSGQIGSNLKKRLKRISKQVKCLSKKELNLEKLSSIKTKLSKFKPNLIINASGFTKVDEAEKNKKKCFKINVSSTKEIADWTFKNKCFLVHYSTVYIFDGKKKKPWSEKDKAKPINYYGKCKLEAEKKIISSKCNYLILRLNWIYNAKGENFPKKIIRIIKKKKKIFLVNNQIGTPNDAEFISVITVKILKKILRKKINPKILNLSARGSINYFDLAGKILKNSQGKLKKVNLIPINSNTYTKINTKQKIAERPLNSLLNITKLERFLNTQMPDWENIFIKKIPTLIKNYKK